MQPQESFISFFPKDAFYRKLASPIPDWMKKQIRKDLSPFENFPITIPRLDATFEKTYNPKSPDSFRRYCIFNNELYRYSPDKKNLSSKNSPFEKALKTLLYYTQVPNCEFLLCTLDGLVEPYMDPNFYKTRKLEDQAPIFAQAKRKEPFTQFIVLIPDQFSLSRTWHSDIQAVEKAIPLVPWEVKKEFLTWRGGFTDTGVPQERSDFSLEASSRYKLCLLSQKHVDLIDSGFTGAGCKLVADSIKKQNLTRPFLLKEEQLKAKYLPVLDGHMCTYPGFQWRLLSNSVAFKQDSDQIQWFYEALQPYIHYVPIKNDLSDLVEKLNWAKKEDFFMQKIAKNSREFALENLLLEDNYLYLYHLLQAYAKLQKMDFTHIQKDPQWIGIQYRKRLQAKRSMRKMGKRLTSFFSKSAGRKAI